MTELEIKEFELKEAKEREEKREAIEAENRKVLLELVSNGELPKPRALNFENLEELEEADLDIRYVENNNMREFTKILAKMQRWILKTAYPDFDFSKLAGNVACAFAMYTFEITNRHELAEKN